MRRSREASVGFVIFLAGMVLIVGILAVGRESRLFTRKVEYWTAFPNVAGLSEGSPVQLVGVQVGTVSRVQFSPDLQDREIRVFLEVDRAFQHRIREGTEAQLKSLSYVSQERFIELTPGDPDRPELPPGSRIEPGLSGFAELTEMGRGIADDVKDITSQLRELLLALNRGGGILSEMIRNPEFGRQSLQDLEETTGSVRRILDRLEKGEGLAGQVLMNREYANRQLSSVEGSLQSLRSILERLEKGEGAAGAFLHPEGKGEEIVENLSAATRSFREGARSFEEGKGLAGRLVQDDETARRILENLEKTTANLESITGKIDRGEGSLGALVNDPEVYEGLRDVVGGIQKSRIGKGILRHYQKKGRKAREAAEAEAQEPPQENP
jgi:phospholipid/cholesterol/gamma-HCH transport system substrate-binding protein